jgi:PHD/YefM family antitoxin component YafN of YafNO toxin-antitoxin module
MKPLLRISISEARARLPELAQRAMASPESVIVIEHRDYSENLVLTTEAHYRMLEALKKKETAALAAGFKLLGSISSDLSDAELEAAMLEVEAEVAAAEERRIARLAKDLR